MFRKNEKHHQPALISAASELPEKQRARLQKSWAGTFYKELFCQEYDEDIFGCLYSEKASRPNVPVNVLIGLEMLKAGFGWSDQELYDHYCYDLQVRYALGYDRIRGRRIRHKKPVLFSGKIEPIHGREKGSIYLKRHLKKSQMNKSRHLQSTPKSNEWIAVK